MSSFEQMRPIGNPGTEIVLALAGAVGSDLCWLAETIEAFAKGFDYAVCHVPISEIIRREFRPDWHPKNEHDRISELMDCGTRFRTDSNRPDVFALAAAAEIARQRSVDEHGMPKSNGRMIYVIRSLKHPREVQALRKIYGSGFFLIAAHASRERRLAYLTNHKSMTVDQAEELISRDAEEPSEFGQHTRDVFGMADLFLRLGNEPTVRSEVSRFLDLLFGSPAHVPSLEEHAMFLAYATSLRSGSLARQVGAVLMSKNDDIIATGANDAPRPGGGQYSSTDSLDNRDVVLGVDRNDVNKEAIVADFVRKLAQRLVSLGCSNLPVWMTEDALSDSMRFDLVKKELKSLGGAEIFALTEFSREVHAEMEALLSAARAHIEVRGSTLYVTTFPCHNCAKHLIGAGVRRVVFVEPYPKSRALSLHDHEVILDEEDQLVCRTDKVFMVPFSGIGPRRYADLFSFNLSAGRPLEKKDKGRRVEWKPHNAESRFELPVLPYVMQEKLLAEEFRQILQSARAGDVGPAGTDMRVDESQAEGRSAGM